MQVSVEKGTCLIIIVGVEITISWFIPKGKITKIKSNKIFAKPTFLQLHLWREWKWCWILFNCSSKHVRRCVCVGGDLCQRLCALHTQIVFDLADWKTVAHPKRSVWLFTQQLLDQKKSSRENNFSVDLRKDQEEQDRSYVSFYKRRNVEWASPLRCTLESTLFVKFNTTFLFYYFFFFLHNLITFYTEYWHLINKYAKLSPSSRRWCCCWLWCDPTHFVNGDAEAENWLQN